MNDARWVETSQYFFSMECPMRRVFMYSYGKSRLCGHSLVPFHSPIFLYCHAALTGIAPVPSLSLWHPAAAVQVVVRGQWNSRRRRRAATPIAAAAALGVANSAARPEGARSTRLATSAASVVLNTLFCVWLHVLMRVCTKCSAHFCTLCCGKGYCSSSAFGAVVRGL